MRKPQEQVTPRKKVFINPKGTMAAAAHANELVTHDQGTTVSMSMRGTEMI